MGVGHTLKGDDALGPELIARLQGKVTAVCIDAGTSPENYLGKVIRERPQTVLIVDAADLGQAPGTYEILTGEEIIQSGFTTHDMSPRMLMEHLHRETKAAIFLLAIQPQHVRLGEEMSPAIQRSLEEIEKVILEAIHA